MVLPTRIFCLLTLVFALCSPPAFAASVVPMSMNDLTKIADDISVVRCVDIRSRWHKNKIVTDNVFTVTERIKGGDSSELIVTVLGGSALHPRLKVPVNMHVPGGLQFEVDDEVLLFTKVNANAERQVVGLTQGRFGIETDPDTGVKRIPVGKKVLTLQDEEKSGVASLFPAFSDFVELGEQVRVRQMALQELIAHIKAGMASDAPE